MYHYCWSKTFGWISLMPLSTLKRDLCLL
uniref:Uncharacterized protein n=1 Tax=Arabidopsis thaliana TaxID=3702 RepID=Q56WF5_ARATH|nr:hypothetical protein [Arabidopsis thaliana]